MPDREKVIAGLTMLADRTNDNTCEGLKCCKIAEDALSSLQELEPVVHCRECKWYERCELNDLMLNHENGFCADGERK